MKSVSIFVKNLISGGAERQSVLLAKALARTHDVHYVIFNGDKIETKYIDILKSDDRIKIKSFSGGHLTRFRDFISYLKQNDIKAIFSYLTAADAYACIAGKCVGAKVFTGIRSSRLPFFKHLADCVFTNFMSTRTVINCYSGMEYFALKGFCRKKFVVIPNGFDGITNYQQKKDDEVVNIITVGRFVPAKDYKTAIESIAILKRQKNANPIKFHIVGYGELESQIYAWIKDFNIEDVVEVHINPNNIPELLLNSDIYLSTSIFEGTSNSIMEAMNANLPVVATNVGDNNYLVDSENGFICNVKDSGGIASSLCELIKDAKLREKMGYNSKKKLEEQFSMDVFRRRYIALLDEWI